MRQTSWRTARCDTSKRKRANWKKHI
uniref:Uncharacterized protein n=1 Tax=Anguilla anguilla TaxID=7936 RepID=A0A0E9TF85_ANGAN